MPRRHKVRKFKPYLMRYLHSADPNYEPVLMDLLDHEHEVYDESTVGEGAESTRGERLPHMWHVVFTELTDILTPFHIEQLFERLERDFAATCRVLREMSDPQPVEKEPAFRHYLMRYLESDDPNYEPVLRDILEHEHEAYDAITASEETLIFSAAITERSPGRRSTASSRASFRPGGSESFSTSWSGISRPPARFSTRWPRRRNSYRKKRADPARPGFQTPCRYRTKSLQSKAYQVE